MFTRQPILTVTTTLTITFSCACVWGQSDAPTLWQWLGIPRGIRALQDATINRHGNFPGLERKPPLKRIADLANLESKVPAIQQAAKIKQAEDMRDQKIKAIKYLARIGCGCYPGVDEAFIAALDDPTEEVRYQTVLAIQQAAYTQCLSCNRVGCCTEELIKTLTEKAYKRDDSGCCVEPSDRVREELVRALRQSCPSTAPPIVIENEQSPPVPLEPDVDREGLINEDEENDGVETEDGIGEGNVLSGDNFTFWAPLPSSDGAFSELSYAPQQEPDDRQRPTTTHVTGKIKALNPVNGRVVISYPRNCIPVIGSLANVHHRYPLHRQSPCKVRIVGIADGHTLAKTAVGLSMMQTGDSVLMVATLRNSHPVTSRPVPPIHKGALAKTNAPDIKSRQ